jgi:hypothetical protein
MNRAHDTPVRVAAVEDRAGLAAFLRMPEVLYRDDPHYVPPLRLEQRRRLSPAHNPYFHHAEARLWIAWHGDRPVGRISAQLDRGSLHRHGDDTGHFGFFEVEDDAAATRALLAAAESWLAGKGMRRIRGPFSLSINDECGLLIDPFDRPPAFLMGHGRPYYAARLEQAGYAKAKDLLSYDWPIAGALADRAERLLHRAKRHARLAVRPLDRRRYEVEMRTILDIFNDAWSDNWGFVPLTEAELDRLARSLRPILRDDLVAIGTIDGVPVSMMVVLPDLNEAIADLGGRLLPFGWLKLLWRLRAGRIGSVRVPLMGVRRRYRGSPLGGALMVLMFDRLARQAHACGYRRAELSWVLEDNAPMRHVAEAFGARVGKTYRIYEKPLSR